MAIFIVGEAVRHGAVTLIVDLSPMSLAKHLTRTGTNDIGMTRSCSQGQPSQIRKGAALLGSRERA